MAGFICFILMLVGFAAMVSSDKHDMEYDAKLAAMTPLQLREHFREYNERRHREECD